MSANERQVGGSHYAKPIQHWDFVVANNIPYLEAQIMKYVFRHREKNGVQDLEKASHFLEKLIEVEKARAKALEAAKEAERAQLQKDVADGFARGAALRADVINVPEFLRTNSKEPAPEEAGPNYVKQD